jgi:hypothetical protein
MADTLFVFAPDFSDYSADPSRVDYACEAYRDMSTRWQLVQDARDLARQARNRAETYLPKFEAETIADWAGRVNLTFADDFYDTTLSEHVGLITATPPQLGDDVPPEIQDLCEDIDGEGNHLEVFAATVIDSALHFGHALLLTDYPDTTAIKTKADERRANARPYVQLYPAPDVYAPQWETVGGAKVLVRVMLRETGTQEAGEFGSMSTTLFREIRQDVTRDEATGRVTGLGAIHWRTWRRVKGDSNAKPTFEELDGGDTVGPSRIPARIVYGGQKLGPMYTKPHLYGLAWKAIEGAQVGSDYAAVMHMCNVPTPIFVGRGTSTEGAPVQMGAGLDFPIGGSATFLEPSGVALASTRQRLEDIQATMRRQGATSADATGGKAMTATEASIYAKQRNAKLARAVRSLQDALEGVLADMASFMGLGDSTNQRAGGSVVVNSDFAGTQIDPAYLTVIVAAYTAGAFPLDALLYALQTGKLPDDFAAGDEALRLIAEQQAAADAKQAADQAALDAMKAQADATAAGGPPPTMPGGPQQKGVTPPALAPFAASAQAKAA